MKCIVEEYFDMECGICLEEKNIFLGVDFRG